MLDSALFVRRQDICLVNPEIAIIEGRKIEVLFYIYYVQVELLYKLQLIQAIYTSCPSYKIGCASYNLHSISPSNKPKLYMHVHLLHAI